MARKRRSIGVFAEATTDRGLQDYEKKSERVPLFSIAAVQRCRNDLQSASNRNCGRRSGVSILKNISVLMFWILDV